MMPTLGRRWLQIPMVVMGLSSCGGQLDDDDVSRGAEDFRSTSLSVSSRNFFSCATCHDEEVASQGAVIKPGAVLAGATLRPSYWGGQEVDLLRSINACRRYFMNDASALVADAAPGRALYAFLTSLETGNPRPVSFTVATSISDVPRGRVAAGQVVFARACLQCHGDPHTGAGRLAEMFPVLPDQAVAAHASYDQRTLRLVFIEKIRHGAFFGYTGVMPPFSDEVLDDAALGDLLEMLGITGQN